MKPGDLSSPYSAADCQQLCSLSASCGATTFTSQGSYTYCYMHFQQVADCQAAEARYDVASGDVPYSCEDNLVTLALTFTLALALTLTLSPKPEP